MNLDLYLGIIIDSWIFLYILIILVLLLVEKKSSMDVLKIIFFSFLLTVVGGALIFLTAQILPVFLDYLGEPFNYIVGAFLFPIIFLAAIITIIGFVMIVQNKFSLRTFSLPLLALLPIINCGVYVAGEKLYRSWLN